MKLNFVKASPSQNTTAFITDYVCPSQYATIANKLMAYDSLSVEQVGYIVKPHSDETVIRLEMSGGEFCGNALLSAAAYCHYRGLSKQENFLVEISGSDIPLNCHVKQKASNIYESRSEMPSPLKIADIELSVKGNQISGKIIKLNGITHFITQFWPKKSDYNDILTELLKQVDDKAIGIIPYKSIKDNEYEIVPFVYVTDTGSKVFERACGSGTLALGVYLNAIEQSAHFHIHQPGGVIQVEAGKSNYISTEVKFTCEGTVNLD